jgi:hypothetical protein
LCIGSYIVQLTVKGLVCSDIFQRCDDIDCPTHCKSLYGNKAYGHLCDDFNLCTCFFEQDSSSISRCLVGLGTCYPGECDQACCDAKCASKFKQAFGNCTPTGNPYTKDRCVCSYRSWKPILIRLL